MRDYEILLTAGNKAQLEKLKENEHKKGFDDIDLYYAFKRIDGEKYELSLELFNREVRTSTGFEHKENLDYSAIRRGAADIANFAYMIINKCDKELMTY